MNTAAGNYVLSARHSAAAVLLEPASTPLKRAYARSYVDDADAMIIKPAGAQSISWQEPS